LGQDEKNIFGEKKCQTRVESSERRVIEVRKFSSVHLKENTSELGERRVT
jgi:hypothetical protein